MHAAAPPADNPAAASFDNSQPEFPAQRRTPAGTGLLRRHGSLLWLWMLPPAFEASGDRLRRTPPVPVQVPKSNEKVAEIDEHIGCAMSGLTADARTLIDHARNETQVRARSHVRSPARSHAHVLPWAAEARKLPRSWCSPVTRACGAGPPFSGRRWICRLRLLVIHLQAASRPWAAGPRQLWYAATDLEAVRVPHAATPVPVQRGDAGGVVYTVSVRLGIAVWGR